MRCGDGVPLSTGERSEWGLCSSLEMNFSFEMVCFSEFRAVFFVRTPTDKCSIFRLKW